MFLLPVWPLLRRVLTADDEIFCSYNTRSNRTRVIKTPGGDLRVLHIKKRGTVPKCGDCGSKLSGVSFGPVGGFCFLATGGWATTERGDVGVKRTTTTTGLDMLGIEEWMFSLIDLGESKRLGTYEATKAAIRVAPLDTLFLAWPPLPLGNRFFLSATPAADTHLI